MLIQNSCRPPGYSAEQATPAKQQASTNIMWGKQQISFGNTGESHSGTAVLMLLGTVFFTAITPYNADKPDKEALCYMQNQAEIAKTPDAAKKLDIIEGCANPTLHAAEEQKNMRRFNEIVAKAVKMAEKAKK